MARTRQKRKPCSKLSARPWKPPSANPRRHRLQRKNNSQVWIWKPGRPRAALIFWTPKDGSLAGKGASSRIRRNVLVMTIAPANRLLSFAEARHIVERHAATQIGRASCRERG